MPRISKKKTFFSPYFQVAIKSLCKERLQNSMFEFMKEYEIMQSIEHPNIVKLFGVVLETSRIMLITELAPLRYWFQVLD